MSVINFKDSQLSGQDILIEGGPQTAMAKAAKIEPTVVSAMAFAAYVNNSKLDREEATEKYLAEFSRMFTELHFFKRDTVMERVNRAASKLECGVSVKMISGSTHKLALVMAMGGNLQRLAAIAATSFYLYGPLDVHMCRELLELGVIAAFQDPMIKPKEQ